MEKALAILLYDRAEAMYHEIMAIYRKYDKEIDRDFQPPEERSAYGFSTYFYSRMISDDLDLIHDALRCNEVFKEGYRLEYCFQDLRNIHREFRRYHRMKILGYSDCKIRIEELTKFKGYGQFLMNEP